MPINLMPLDAIALAWFVAAWLGYNLSFDYLLRRPESLNRYMRTVRHFWMARMIERDNRIADAALLGHLIHNVSFFASTTLLVLAGLLGVIGTLDDIFGAVADLGVMVETTQALFEFKVLLLVAIFIFAFFKLTWALRQFNYCCGLIGASPSAPVPDAERERVAEPVAEMLSLATESFNGGLRAYYFALAALGWFVSPWLFMAMTAWVVGVLLRRQIASSAMSAVRRFSQSAGANRKTD